MTQCTCTDITLDTEGHCTCVRTRGVRLADAFMLIGVVTACSAIGFYAGWLSAL